MLKYPQKEKQMVKHIILWTLKEMSDSEKESVKAGIKEGLEGLKGKIPGLVDIKVNTSGRLPSSTADLMLDSTFESEEALKGYSKHPEHVAVADSKVRPFTASRACLDFEIKERSKMKKQILLPLILTLTFTANALPSNDLIYREIKNRWEGEKGIWLHILKTAEYSEDGKNNRSRRMVDHRRIQ